MQLAKGDKVRFLNEKGEGVIVRMADRNTAIVEVEDGFEYPYPIDQLVPVAPIQKTTTVSDQRSKTADVTGDVFAAEPVNSRFPDGIYFAFIPQNQAMPSAGKVDLVLYNHDDYSVYFTVSLKDGNEWVCIQHGKLAGRKSLYLDTLTPAEIDNWSQVKTDILFYSDEPYKHRAPVSGLLKLKGVKFFKDTTFSQHLLTGKKSFVAEIVITDFTTPVEDKPFVSNDQLKKMMELKDHLSSRPKVSVPHLKNQLLEKEVDLHIEELLDNWNGMSNAQLLDIQLRHMQKELDAAMAAHMRRIVFIHGVGNGRLKQEVRKILTGYKGIRFHDASYQKYGFGATEVEIL